MILKLEAFWKSSAFLKPVNVGPAIGDAYRFETLEGHYLISSHLRQAPWLEPSADGRG